MSVYKFIKKKDDFHSVAANGEYSARKLKRRNERSVNAPGRQRAVLFVEDILIREFWIKLFDNNNNIFLSDLGYIFWF